MKDDIVEISEKDSECILKMNPVTFHFKDTPGSRNIGLIAQEVEEAMTDTDLPPIANMYGEHYSMNYTSLIPLLIKQIQVLNKRIEILESVLLPPIKSESNI